MSSILSITNQSGHIVIINLSHIDDTNYGCYDIHNHQLDINETKQSDAIPLNHSFHLHITYTTKEGNKNHTYTIQTNASNTNCYIIGSNFQIQGPGGKWISALGAATSMAVAGTAGTTLAVVGVQAAGFTATGIAGGSTAASMMSAAAIANGGTIASGSVVATLQSIGATGALGLGVGAGVFIVSAVVGGGALYYGGRAIIHSFTRKNQK